MSLNDPGAAATKPRFFPDAAVRSGRSAGASGPSGPPMDGLLAWYFSTLPVDGTTVPDKVGGRNAAASSSALDGKTVWDDTGVTIQLPADADLLAADKWSFLFDAGDAPLSLALPSQLLEDGDMEAAGAGAWEVYQNATLTKETADPHGGTRCLRCAYNGTSGAGVSQAVLPAGKMVRVTGYARTSAPNVQAYVYAGDTAAVTNAQTWTYFEVIQFAAANRLYLYSNAGASGAYVEWDDVRAELVMSDTGRTLRTNTGNMIFARIEDDQARDILVYDAPLAGEALARARAFVGDTSPAWIAPLLTTLCSSGFDPTVELDGDCDLLPTWWWGDRTISTGADPGGHTYSGAGPWQAILGPPELYGGVTELWGENDQLTGALNPDLGSLAALKTLFLYDNNLSGGLPEELGDIAGMENFAANANSFGGGIPRSFGNWTELTGLNLAGCDLTGLVPAEIGSLVSAQLLQLQNNALSGIEAGAVGGLAAIRDLRLQGNGMAQAAVDAIIDEIWTNRAGYTYAGGIALNIAGTNAAPGGTYQYAATPSTPLEKVYALGHPEEFGYGWNPWSITCTS